MGSVKEEDSLLLFKNVLLVEVEENQPERGKEFEMKRN